MAKGIFRLSAADLRRNVPGLYGDGGGLWLQITPRRGGGTNRSWVFRFTIRGRSREMGLGSLDTISLAEARERARRCRQQLLDGIDPLELRKTQRAAQTVAIKRQMTFDQCARAFISAKRSEWRSEKHARQWPATLATYASPTIGGLPIDVIDTALVMKVLEPIWVAKPETASRLRGRIESVLDWATVGKFRQGENPARWSGHLEHLLAKKTKIKSITHHPAMPYADVPAFMTKLRAVDSIAARALEFLVHTSGRRAEVLGMTWDEVDLDAQVWTVPGTRMKSGKPHRKPLPPRCMEILQAMRAVRRSDDLVFPGRDGHPLGGTNITALMGRLGCVGYALHGFRSSFRDWAAERTNFPREVAEQALAHTVRSPTERAYARSDLLEQRARLMAAWAEFCARPAPVGATVVDFSVAVH